MRLFWKQFLCMVGLVMGSFIVFGSILIHTSFRMSLDREKEKALQTLQMYQYSMVASLESLPKDYSMVVITASEIAQTIQENMGDNGSEISIYDGVGNTLYQSADFKTDLISQWGKMNNGLQQIEIHMGKHYLESIVQTKTTVGTFYLEIDENIEYLYVSRQQLYESYQRILFLVFFVTGILAAILSFQLARPVKQLSAATRQFAGGHYESRVKKRGNDEVTDLMEDFNSMADRLEDSIEQLKEAARRQEEFTSAFAHELKTPLTSIVGYSEALRSMDLTKEEQCLSANYIYHQGKRLESLAYKMLELTGIQNQEWDFKNVKVMDLANSVKSTTSQVLKEKNITLKLEVEPGEIYGDMELLESLMINLVDNARKASSRNSIIHLHGAKTDEGYQFQVIDHGHGIPETEIAKVHEAFYMVDKSRARKEGGAGIGMALCERILMLHHGTWEIESSVGIGTTITLSFGEVKL